MTSETAPRVLVVASHPIQYQAPWFRGLAQATDIEFSVLFAQLPNASQQGRGFGVPFEWDVPVLEGYRWQEVAQTRGPGGLHGFFSSRIHDARGLLRALAPDVVIVTGWHMWPLLQMLIAARRAGVPVIMRGESNALRRRAWPTRMLHGLLLRSCAAFLPIGQASRNFYLRYGISERRLFDTPYFVDNARFAASAAAFESRRAALRERWGVPQNCVCFCYAGKLEPKKRILDLLEALHIALRTSVQPLHLLVVGTGELMPQAQSAIKLNQLPATLAGFLNQTEIPAAYVASDCLVLPSDFGETWGLVVNESMACGRPAIVSDRVGCGPDLITPDETGVVFPFGDTAALAAALVAMAANPQRLRAMGARAHDRVMRSYSVERAVTRTLDAVNYVLQRR